MDALFAAFEITTLVPIAVFGAIATLVWFLFDFFSSKNPRAEERLAEFNDPTRRRQGQKDGAQKKSDAMDKVLEKASPALARFQPKSKEQLSKIKRKLSYAGFRSEAAPTMFFGIKLISVVTAVFLSAGTLLFVSGMSRDTLVRTIIISGVMFYLPDFVLWYLARRRKDAIFRSLPDCLDLMVVCVEAGLGLDQAMRKVADEMEKAYPVLCDELSLCNLQMQMGRPRIDVLQDLGLRTGVDDLRSLASILVQADKFGSSVGKALRVQSDSMRTRRHQLAEEKAAKTAVQLIFPLVLFIFPGIFVVLVAPAGITMVREMFPKMAGG